MSEEKKDVVDWNTLELLQRIVRNADRELDRPKVSTDIQEGIPSWVHVPMLSFLSDTMINTRYRHIVVSGVFANIKDKPRPVDVIILGTTYQDNADGTHRAVHITLFNKVTVDGTDHHNRLELVGFIQKHNKTEVGVVSGMVLDSKLNKGVIYDHPAIAKAAKVLALSFQEINWTDSIDETIKED